MFFLEALCSFEISTMAPRQKKIFPKHFEIPARKSICNGVSLRKSSPLPSARIQLKVRAETMGAIWSLEKASLLTAWRKPNACSVLSFSRTHGNWCCELWPAAMILLYIHTGCNPKQLSNTGLRAMQLHVCSLTLKKCPWVKCPPLQNEDHVPLAHLYQYWKVG